MVGEEGRRPRDVRNGGRGVKERWRRKRKVVRGVVSLYVVDKVVGRPSFPIRPRQPRWGRTMAEVGKGCLLAVSPFINKNR